MTILFFSSFSLVNSDSCDRHKNGTLAQHGIVLVTVNYRLGVFGFLAHPEPTRESPHQTSGNNGLMEIAALGWVRENIAAFGSDRDKVAVFGQSAGAEGTEPAEGLSPIKGIVSTNHRPKRIGFYATVRSAGY